MKKIFTISPNMDSEREQLAEEIIKWIKEKGEEYESYSVIVEIIKD